MPQPQLEGQIIDVDTRDATIDGLRVELLNARTELETLQRQRRAEYRAMLSLRQQLRPFYELMATIFGDIEEMAGDDEPRKDVSAQTAVVWEQWKSRLGVTASKIITALQTHKTLSTQQLSMVTGLHRTTIPAGIFKLNKAGLLNKNGGMFSLKQL